MPEEPTSRLPIVVAAGILLIIILGGVFVWMQFQGFGTTPEARAIDSAFAKGDIPALIAAAEAGVQKYPEDPDAFTALALAYAHAGSVSFAEESYGQLSIAAANRAIELGSRKPEAYRALGYAHEIMGTYLEALEAYDKGLAMEPSYAPLLSQRGHVLDLMGRTSEAAEYYEKALAADGQLEQARLNYARHLIQEGSPASVEKARTLAHELAIGAYSMQGRASGYNVLGSIEYNAKNYDAAIDAFTQSLKLDPTLVQSGMGLAWARFETLPSLRDDERALAARVRSISTLIQTTITNHPDDTSAYHLAGLLTAFLGNKEDAERLLVQARDVILPRDITLGEDEKAAMRTTITANLGAL